MFDIGWGELLLIGIVALIAIGPKELPTVLRTLGQWMAKLRRMATEFQNQFHEAMREAELADLKKQVDDLTTQAQGYTHFDPVGDVRKELEGTQHEIERAISDQPAPAPAPVATTDQPAPPAPPAASNVPSGAEPTPSSDQHAAASPTAPADAATDPGKGDAGGKAA
jgi:sec-independent protein translocase protein TatB